MTPKKPEKTTQDKFVKYTRLLFDEERKEIIQMRKQFHHASKNPDTIRIRGMLTEDLNRHDKYREIFERMITGA